MRTKISGIYVVEVPAIRAVYVGQSTNIKSRWSQHKHVFRRGTCEIKEMQEAWDKYGEDGFVFRVVETTNEDLRVKEQQYAQQYVDDGWTLFNSYFHVKVRSLMISEEHIPIVTKLLRLVTKGRLDIKQLDQHLDTL